MSDEPRKFDPNALMKKLASLPTTEKDPPAIYGEAARRAHEESEERSLESHLVKCGVPSSLASASAAGKVADGPRYPAVEALRDWTTRPGAVFLLLAGGAGSGKTTAAVEALRLARSPFYGYDSGGTVFYSWQYDARKGMFLSAVDLDEHAPWTPEGERMWTRAKKVRLLVVDDLGTETQTEKGPFLASFQELMRKRHADELQTVFTTNLDGATFKARYGARVLGRITERGIAFNAGNESKRGSLA